MSEAMEAVLATMAEPCVDAVRERQKEPAGGDIHKDQDHGRDRDRDRLMTRRLMTSFQMDADVAQVLAQVEEDGRLKSRFINEACRRLGRLRGYRVKRRKPVAGAGE